MQYIELLCRFFHIARSNNEVKKGPYTGTVAKYNLCIVRRTRPIVNNGGGDGIGRAGLMYFVAITSERVWSGGGEKHGRLDKLDERVIEGPSTESPVRL